MFGYICCNVEIAYHMVELQPMRMVELQPMKMLLDLAELSVANIHCLFRAISIFVDFINHHGGVTADE